MRKYKVYINKKIYYYVYNLSSLYNNLHYYCIAVKKIL